MSRSARAWARHAGPGVSRAAGPELERVVDARSDRARADGAHPPSAENVTHAEPTEACSRDYAEEPCGCPICRAVAHQCDNRGEGETAPPGQRAERAARL